MSETWKPKVGDVVWVRAVVMSVDGSTVPVCVKFPRGAAVWEKLDSLRPTPPAPAELDDVAVLRRAAALMRGSPSLDYCAAQIKSEADRLEAARRVPTPLELIEQYDRIQADAWPGGPDEMPARHPELDLWRKVRAAIAKAKGEAP